MLKCGNYLETKAFGFRKVSSMVVLWVRKPKARGRGPEFEEGSLLRAAFSRYFEA